ncbi:MAG: 30S ribosomal protein S7 [Alphaproteobacteria bacterium]|nr:30S ribosomal protein S7 [Alphaproteobacteria bacterium]
MSRRHAAKERVVFPDAKFGSLVISKFMSSLMYDGKRSAAEEIVYGALDIVAAKSGKDPLEVFNAAMDQVKPSVEVRSRRVGGATYQVPTEVRAKRQTALAIRWLITSVRARGEKTTAQRLAGEIMDAAAGRGNAIKKREDTHRMAEANKAFSHYRW